MIESQKSVSWGMTDKVNDIKNRGFENELQRMIPPTISDVYTSMNHNKYNKHVQLLSKEN